jgi:hypothetical protein
VRALGIKALVFLAIVFSGLEAIVVRLTAGIFAVVKDVVAIVTKTIRIIAVRVPPPTPISKSKWTIYAIGIRADDHDSAPILRLGFR